MGLVGAERYRSMILAQVHSASGMHVVGITDISTERAHQGALKLVD